MKYKWDRQYLHPWRHTVCRYRLQHFILLCTV